MIIIIIIIISATEREENVVEKLLFKASFNKVLYTPLSNLLYFYTSTTIKRTVITILSLKL